ncbi:hypothetical protein [Azospirillum argentinense]
MLFGAIRWDAYYGNANSGISAETARCLSAATARSRAPLHADITRPRVTYSPTVATMEAEITAAKNGGLAYWAFLRYASGSEMNNAFDLYQSASNKTDVKYCWIVTTSTMGSTGNYASQVAEVVTRMQDAHWQKVGSNRPLLYVSYDTGGLSANWGNNAANFKVALDAIRTQAQAAGLGDPYIAVLVWSQAVATVVTATGADAATNYISFNRRIKVAAPASDLRADVESYWTTLAAGASQVVPILQAGWDPRPIMERPMQWYQLPTAMGKEVYFVRPTASEFAAHCQAAKDWMAARPAVCPYQTALIYAWNEHLEGGWLAPTKGDPTGTLLSQTAPIIGS